MVAVLALRETRYVSRSALPWVGLIVAIGVALRSTRGLWPAVSGDGALAYHQVQVLSVFMFLAGGWMGVRDHRARMDELIASTRMSGAVVILSRLIAITTLGAGLSFLLFATGVGVSLGRGAHGIPDLRLIADGALGAAFAGALGLAVGAMTRAPSVTLLSAPLYGVLLLWLGSARLAESARWSIQWLSPAPRLPQQSLRLGFLPDIYGLHPLFVGGLVLSLGLGLIVASAGLRRPAALILIASMVGTGIVGSRLIALPDSQRIRGPKTGDRVALFHSVDGLDDPAPVALSDPGGATSCVRRAPLSACVYPGYGARYAALLLSAMEPEARLFEGFSGIATHVRMVPTTGGGCRGLSESEILFQETRLKDSLQAETLRGYVLHCAFLDVDSRVFATEVDKLPTASQAAVELWALIETGAVKRSALEDALAKPRSAPCPLELTCAPLFDAVFTFGPTRWTADQVQAASNMAAHPVTEVKARLSAVWNRLRHGSLPLVDLPDAGRR